jgi:hypothetical protein
MTNQALAAFARIETAAASAASTDLAAKTPDGLCQSYHNVEPDIKAVLPVIALIPDYGPAIVSALTMLMKIADALCPAEGG